MLVNQALKTKGWSVRRCSGEYKKYRSAYPYGTSPSEISKDTIHRIRRGQFEVINSRVEALCDFLGINLRTSTYQTASNNRFSAEFASVEALAEKQPELEKTIKSLLRNINDIATFRG